MRKVLTFHSINSGKFPLFHEKRSQSEIRKYLHMFIWGLWGVDSWKNQEKKSSASAFGYYFVTVQYYG
jgi:hypothetical protein